MEPLKIDWQKLILNLRQKIKTEQIAQKTGVSISCINNIAAGNVTNPLFYTGLLLLNMHVDHCPEQHKKLWIK